MTHVPPPGSDLAIAAGCLCFLVATDHDCPEAPLVSVAADCPLHGFDRLPTDNELDAEAYDQARTEANDDPRL